MHLNRFRGVTDGEAADQSLSEARTAQPEVRHVAPGPAGSRVVRFESSRRSDRLRSTRVHVAAILGEPPSGSAA